jgi:hypothetical protein
MLRFVVVFNEMTKTLINLCSDRNGPVFDWITVTPEPDGDLNGLLSWTSKFLQLFIPPLLSFYVTAVLVQLPGTRWIRIALLPVTISLSFRASTQLDLSFGYDTLMLLNVVFSVCHLVATS